MPLGVYVACEDLAETEALSNALESVDDLYLSPAADRADVVIAAPSMLDVVPPGPAVVVLAAGPDPLSAAREAVARGAQGILGWPADEGLLSLRLHDAASRRARGDAPPGRLVSVLGARGGAGASTVAAYLARGLGALLVDLAGGAAGQAVFAPTEPPTTISDLGPLLGEVTAEVIERASHDHAAGVRCLYRGAGLSPSLGRLATALREVGGVAVVDGAIQADLTLVVLGPDVGSVRAAVAMAGDAGGSSRAAGDAGGSSRAAGDAAGSSRAAGDTVEFVLNRAARGRVRAADVERALGRKPLEVIPDDPRLARASDLGRVLARGEAARRLRRLGKRVQARS